MSTKPPTQPPPKTPAPPKTRSGEMAAVKVFREAIDVYNDETVPGMDVQVDRMEALRKKVTITPAVEVDRMTDPIPMAPRTPSMIDEGEMPEAPITVPEFDDSPDSAPEKHKP